MWTFLLLGRCLFSEGKVICPHSLDMRLSFVTGELAVRYWKANVFDLRVQGHVWCLSYLGYLALTWRTGPVRVISGEVTGPDFLWAKGRPPCGRRLAEPGWQQVVGRGNWSGLTLSTGMRLAECPLRGWGVGLISLRNWPLSILMQWVLSILTFSNRNACFCLFWILESLFSSQTLVVIPLKCIIQCFFDRFTGLGTITSV